MYTKWWHTGKEGYKKENKNKQKQMDMQMATVGKAMYECTMNKRTAGALQVGSLDTHASAAAL